MLEEDRIKWELYSLTTRRGRYPAPVRANFAADHAFRRAFRRLLPYPHRKHRKFISDAVFERYSNRVMCRESQFSDFVPLTGPMARKNGEIPTYTQQVNKAVGFTLNQQSHAGIVTA
jgi:hypothetical protein